MNILIFSLGFLILIGIILFVLSGHLKNFKNSREKILILGSFLFAAIFSITAYYFWGGSNELFDYYHEKKLAPIVAQWRRDFPNIESVINRMEKRLAQDPNSAQGWYLLGRLYFSQKKYEKAESAFAKAQVLRPQDTLILIERAAALLYAKDHPEYLAQAFELLQKVINQHPNNFAANNLLGVWAFRDRKYQVAIKYWQATLAVVQPNSPEYQSLVEAINQAEQLRTAKKSQDLLHNRVFYSNARHASFEERSLQTSK